MFKIFFGLILLITTSFAVANSNVLNIYIWTGYLPNDVIKKFEKSTGIKINLSEFDSNETLYAKLKTAPHAGYDLITPSSYFVDRMRRQNMLHPLDKTSLTNFKYLNPLFLNKKFDPHNQYSIPYAWGTTGIVVNRKYFDPDTIQNWRDFWDKRFSNQLIMLDDVREVFGIALITLGYSINDTNPKHIYQAYLKLKTLLPNIKVFNSDAEFNIYIDEDATVGMGWSGDIGLTQEENKDLAYIYPKDGFSVWIDCLAIAQNAPHLKAAHEFLNFIMQPEIAAEISKINHYPTPNLAAIKLLPHSMRNNIILNPSAKTLSRGRFQEDIGNAIEIYTKYWELLKIGG